MVPLNENDGERQIRETVPSLSLAIAPKKNLRSRIRETLTVKHRKHICCINRYHFKQLLFRFKLHFAAMQRTSKLKRGIIEQEG